MRSMLVIGLGRFGTNLAIKLSELKNEVMVVDRSEAAVNAIAPQVTSAYAGNCMDEEVVRALGVGNFDVCFVCISDDFQSSLEITSLLKEHGAKYVVSKTDRAMHAKFLRKLGADAVVYPERDMAHRVAIRYSAQNVFDYVEITPEYAVQEMRVPASWAGKTLRQLDVRAKHGVNVIGEKEGERVRPIVDADYRLPENAHLLISGERKTLEKLAVN